MDDEVDWEAAASEYLFQVEQRDFTIERRSATTWVVASSRFVLDPELIEFVYESMPSHRTEEFIQATRFKSKEEAYAQLKRYWDTHERVGPGWRRKDNAPPLPEEDEEDKDDE